MGTLTKQPQLSNLINEKEVQQYASIALSELYQEVNGNLEFGSNILADGPYGVTFPDSLTVVKVPHKLGAVPTGVLEIKRNLPAITFAPVGASYVWTNTNIFLQASQQAVIQLYII